MIKTTILFSSVLLMACGGDDSSVTNPDGSTDGTTSDVQSDDGGGNDTSTGDAEPTVDASDCTGNDAGRAECLKCCGTDYPGGAQVFLAAIEGCACKPEICGAVDGGADGGDGGVFGEGACSKSCGTTTAPDKTCTVCLHDSVMNKGAAGPCASSVITACGSSTDCKKYYACTKSCP